MIVLQNLTKVFNLHRSSQVVADNINAVFPTGASVALLATYFSAMLRSARRGLLLAGFVAVLYGALYGLLASESHALMLGSLLVFGMLATLMLATRHVDWWSLGNPSR